MEQSYRTGENARFHYELEIKPSESKIPHVLKTGFKEMQHNLQMTHSEVLVEVLYEGSPGLGVFRVGTRWAPGTWLDGRHLHLPRRHWRPWVL